MKHLCLAALLLCVTAGAASRPRFGGQLRVGVAQPAARLSPGLHDAPVDVAVQSLTLRSLCRIDRTGQPVAGLATLTPGPGSVRVKLKPNLIKPDGTALTATDVAAHFSRLSKDPSPYRALLAGLPTVVDPLTLDFPGDADALCHPAFALPIGPFLPGTPLLPNPFFPEGRPFADSLALSFDPRLERTMAQKKVDVALGTARAPEGAPHPLATVLLWAKAKAPPELPLFLNALIDRADLAHNFTRAPAEPLSSDATGEKPAPLKPERALTLLFDAANEDHLQAAQRLQFKLAAAGIKLAFTSLPRAELNRRVAAGDFELALQAVLLPPRAELKERLLKSLGLAFPLYAQGLGWQARSEVQGIETDGYGTPMLDGAFFGAE